MGRDPAMLATEGESIRILLLQIEVARSPSVTLRVPPSSRRKALLHLTVYLQSVTHYTLKGKESEKEYEQNARTPFRPETNLVYRRCEEMELYKINLS